MSDPKIAVVTGASRGIGKAIASQLLSSGFKVMGTSTSKEGAAQVPGLGVVLNVSSQASIEDFKKSLEGIGPVSILVNNAGITRDNLFIRMKEEEWSEVIDTNLNAAYRVTRLCLKAMMKARWGRVVNISSVVGSMGNAGQTNYVASKAGMEGFTRALAREVAPWNITVNAVAPGMIDTDMTKELSEAQKDLFKKQIPLARLGKPEDIAETVGFLCSEASQYITGQTIHVNGGLFMN